MTAEEYIDNYTNRRSNELTWNGEDGLPSYHDWISPRNAKIAVAMSREQLIDKAVKWLKSYRRETSDGMGWIAGIIDDTTIEDFRKEMEE